MTTTAGNTTTRAVHARAGRQDHRELQHHDRRRPPTRPAGAVALVVQRRDGDARASPPRARRTTSIASPQTLFPFMVTTPGNYTNNYTVWAGSCVGRQAAAVANQRNVTVGPGQTASATGASAVAMPGMVVRVTYDGTAVKPAHIKLTDSCGQTWQPAVDARLDDAEHGLARPARASPTAPTRSAPTTSSNSSGSSTDAEHFQQGHAHRPREHELHGRELEHGRDRHHVERRGSADGRPRVSRAESAPRSPASPWSSCSSCCSPRPSSRSALFAFQDVTLRQTTRVFAKVDATQRARTTMELIETRLHSSCVVGERDPDPRGQHRHEPRASSASTARRRA